MKKILLWSLLVLMSAGTVSATESDSTNSFALKPMEVETEDILNYLEMQNVFLKKFDLSTVKDSTLELVYRVDEYTEGGEKQILDEDSFGQAFKTSPRGKEGSNFTLIISSRDDSTASFFLVAKTGSQGVSINKKRAAPDYENYSRYKLNMFRASELKVDAFVPVALLGSAWYDTVSSERYGRPIYRFCMEPMLPTDMKSESFEKMPHYIVLSLGLRNSQK